jgi:hypothetical protein
VRVDQCLKTGFVYGRTVLVDGVNERRIDIGADDIESF